MQNSNSAHQTAFRKKFSNLSLYLFTRTLLINLPKTLPFPALTLNNRTLSMSTTLFGVDALLLPWKQEDGAEDARDQIDKHDPSPTFHGLCVFSWHFVRIREKKEESQLKKAFCGLFAWILDYDWSGIVPSHWLNSNLINLGIGWAWTQLLQDFAAFVLCSYCGKY